MEEEIVEYNRYVYFFDNEITTETVQKAIDILVGIPSVDLFISTPGGETCAMWAFIHFINNHSDMEVYLTNYIASAGTFLLTDCTKKIHLCNDLDFILFHQEDRVVEGQFRKRVLDYQILYSQLKEENDNLALKYKALGLTNKELSEYNKGLDVVLYKKDFKRLQKNINKNLELSK